MNGLWVPDRKLHLPPLTSRELRQVPLMGAFVELGAWDKNHKLIQQFREVSHSPVKQFLQIILGQWNVVTLAVGTVAETDGTTSGYANNDASRMYAKGAADNDLLGIVVGTGSTAVDITDYKLATQILQGSAANKLKYNGDDGDLVVTVTDPNCTFNKWRNFNNFSGAAITVAETGIYVNMVPAGQGGGIYLMFVRDVPASVSVPNDGGCYVKYTLKISE